MVFSSATFLFFFLPIVFVLYYVLPKSCRNWILLLASVLFYSWGEPIFIFVLLASITVDFFIALKMSQTELRIRKRWLALSLIINLGLLGFFKYANFFIDNVQHFYHWMGLEPFAWHTVALPIGISFVTFQKISYMVDVFRKDCEPQRRWDYLTLYILMFPQLIAGPIIRYKEIAVQLTERDKANLVEYRIGGLYRFFIGLSKKMLIANVLAQQVDVIFATSPNALSAGTAWIGMLAYTMQIYFDFSGYSDMALGLGRMFGFQFPENFNFPYISQSFSEFWKRWHITLGSWMKDYLYIPLGGNRIGRGRTLVNLWVVFLLSGLWHGAAWTFVAWGLYHGLFIVLDKLGAGRWLKKLGRVPATLVTFLLVMIGWVIFRADSLSYCGAYIARLFSFSNMPDCILWDARFVVILVVALLAAFSGVIPAVEKYACDAMTLPRTHLRWIILTIFVIVLYLINGSAILAGGFNPFIYFRF